MSYRIKKISDQVLNWRTDNNYPYIKTIIIDRDRWYLQKILFNFFIIEDLVDNKYYDTLEEAETFKKMYETYKIKLRDEKPI